MGKSFTSGLKLSFDCSIAIQGHSRSSSDMRVVSNIYTQPAFYRDAGLAPFDNGRKVRVSVRDGHNSSTID